MMNHHKPVPPYFSLLIVLALLVGSALVVTPVSSASDIEVANNNNAGVGSLRSAIEDIPHGGTITFDPSLSGQTITLTSTTLVINKSLTIDGSSLAVPITISGNNSVGVFTVGSTVEHATLDSLKIINGNRESGGGISNFGHLTVTNCTISGNKAQQEDGGGIYNQGELTILNSTLSENNAQGDGGGIFNIGHLALVKSTLSGNSAIFGGGIFNLDVRNKAESNLSKNMSYNDGEIIRDEISQGLDVINSTLSGNTAEANGGGIFNGGNLLVGNSTLYGNAAVYGGGIFNLSELLLINTIIAHSTEGDCVNIGTIHSDSTHNLVETEIEEHSCEATLAPDLSYKIGILADNGGPTLTHALLPGSPAIDAGRNDDLCPMTDQRGVSRPQDGNGDGFEHCDIGAFEFDPDRDGVNFIFLPLILR